MPVSVPRNLPQSVVYIRVRYSFSRKNNALAGRFEEQCVQDPLLYSHGTADILHELHLCKYFEISHVVLYLKTVRF